MRRARILAAIAGGLVTAVVLVMLARGRGQAGPAGARLPRWPYDEVRDYRIELKTAVTSGSKMLIDLRLAGKLALAAR